MQSGILGDHNDTTWPHSQMLQIHLAHWFSCVQRLHQVNLYDAATDGGMHHQMDTIKYCIKNPQYSLLQKQHDAQNVATNFLLEDQQTPKKVIP